MKKSVAVSLAMAGVIAWGGVALADGEAAAQGKAPEPNTWQYSLALETGKLPVDHSKVDAAKNRTSRGSDSVVEIDGVVYRLGVDTQ